VTDTLFGTQDVGATLKQHNGTITESLASGG
jgi:multiple sugar transport system substrate-binding protein